MPARWFTTHVKHDKIKKNVASFDLGLETMKSQTIFSFHIYSGKTDTLISSVGYLLLFSHNYNTRDKNN